MRRDGSAPVVVGILAGIGAVALVSGVIALFERSGVPVLSLGALYVFAVLPAAVFWGAWLAVPVGLLSMLVFNFFFLPPTRTLHLRDDANWVVLAMYLVVAVVVSELAARSRRRAAEALVREREAVLLGAIATSLLADSSLDEALGAASEHLAAVLGAQAIVVAPGPTPVAAPDGGSVLPLVSGSERVGTLVVDGPVRAPEATVARLLPAVAALLALAVQREALEAEALEAEKLRTSDAIKTTILRSVSHDLRSPLTAIRAASDGLVNPALAAVPADREALASTVREEVDRLDRLVGDLLDLSRLEAGAIIPEVAYWPVEDLVWRALEAVGADEQVEVDVPHDLPPVAADGVQIVRALANLLENARVHARSRVSLTAVPDGNEVVIDVANDGEPVAPDERERIFEPFRRGSGATTGTGLGLAIARGFVTVNGGSVAVAPEAVGARFVVRLPAHEIPASELE